MKDNVKPAAERGVGGGGLRLAAGVLLGGYLLLTVYLLWRTSVLRPFSDELDWAFRWYQLQGDHRWLDYLLAPHNLNRLVWTRLLLALDMGAGGGTNAPLILSGGLSLGATAAMLGVQAFRAAPEPLKLPWAALSAMLTLTAANVMDASFPINVTYTHAAVFAVFAILLAEGAPAEGEPRSALGWRGAGAILAASASAFGSGGGLAVWPVMAWGALRRRDWPWLAAVVVAGAAFVGLYFAGQHHGATADALPALHDPKSAILLALDFLVLPWTRLALHTAWIAGLIVAGVATWLALAKGGPAASPTERAACGLILFSLAAAAMAGLGRSGVTDPYNVPIRYGLLVAPLQTGVLMLAAPWAGRLWSARRALAQGLVAAVLLAAFAQNAVLAVKVVRASDVMRELIADFLAGQRTPQMPILIHPSADYAKAMYARLDHDGLFQHELHLKPPAPTR